MKVSKIIPIRLVLIGASITAAIIMIAGYSIFSMYREIERFNTNLLPSLELSYSTLRTTGEVEFLLRNKELNLEEIKTRVFVLPSAIDELLVLGDAQSKGHLFFKSDYYQVLKEKFLLGNLDKFEQRDVQLLAENLSILVDDNISYSNTLIRKSILFTIIASIILIIGLISLIFMFVVIYRRYVLNLKRLQETEEILENERLAALENSKLAAVGEMVAGVAHEINNPLAVIMGRSEILKRKIESGKANEMVVTDSLTKIEEMSHRISKIIISMRRMSRQSETDEFEDVDVSLIIDDIKTISTDRLKSLQIDLSLTGFEAPILIKGSFTNLPQILINLLNNSIDALEPVTDRKRLINVSATKDKNLVILRVTDNGAGIPSDTLEKIYNPFFTTKDVGKGTGLGLPISKNLVEKMGGTIKHIPTEMGTCFEITLNSN